MDVTIINPFLNAVQDVYRQMFFLETVAAPAFVLEEHATHRWDISGILGVTGDYAGIVCFRLHKMLAEKLLEIAGIEFFSDEERQDTMYEMIGEVTNIVSGNAASKLGDINVEISPPAVVMGKNHKIAWPRGIPVIGIPFSTPKGPFEVDVCFQQKI